MSEKPRFELTLHLSEEEGYRSKIEITHHDLGWMLWKAVRTLGSARISCVFAAAVCEIDDESTSEFWPGYKDATERFFKAAEDIVEGWEKHDERWKKRS